MLTKQFETLCQYVRTGKVNTDVSTRDTIIALLEAVRAALSSETPLSIIERLSKKCRSPKPFYLDSKSALKSLQSIRTIRRLARARADYPGRRKLDPYYQAICRLLEVGASQQDIQCWLRREHDCQVAQSTLHRYLKRYETKKTHTQKTRH